MLQTIVNNRYKIVKVLGEGGFGKTFLTEDTHLPSGRRCVIKQLKPVTENPQIHKMVQDRFQREAAILEDLGNSNNRIPNLYAYFAEQGQFYLVQEYVEGKTLAEKIHTEGVMSESAVREILKSLLYVLNFVHSKHIIHRDIKPDNIILRDADSVPVLIDFGAVRESMGTVVNSQGNPTSSIVIGTPGFMPPEQAAGRPVYSSDLYSLAITMIYLLTGRMPQELQTDPRTAEIMWHQYAMNVSPSLRMILDKAIAYHPGDRYPTAKDMIDALQSSAVNPAVNNYVAPTQSSSQYNTPASPNPGGYSPPPTVINSRGQNPQHIQPVITPVGSNPNWSGGNYNPQQYVSPAATTNSGLLGGGGTFNTDVPVPPEIQGWNWGAFLLSPLWSITNQVWIGLLSWVPYVGIPMPFILGAKGNTWAWRSRQWRSIEDFKAHQRVWTKAGIIVYSSFGALIVLLAVIGGIASQQEDTDTPSSTPTQVSPSPSESSSPSSSSSSSSSSSETTTSNSQRVTIGNLKTYSYETRLFSIDVPEGWDLKDNSNANEVIIYWLDPTENALIQVNVFNTQNNPTQEELTNILKRFINKFAAKEQDFITEQPVRQKDGSVRITWSYTAKSGNSSISLTANSFIKSQEDKISIDSYIVPSEQYKELLPTVNQIIGSYKLNASFPFK